MTSTTKAAVVISPFAYASILLHAERYQTSVVHGILVGSVSDEKTVSVKRALPTCHEAPTKPLIDTALALTQASLMDDEEIVGWYTAPENLNDEHPGPAALRIVAALDSPDLEPILLLVRNEELVKVFRGDESCQSVFMIFGKDFGQQWLDKLDNVTVTNESGAMTAVKEASRSNLEIADLVEHWASQADFPDNKELVSLLKKHC